MLFNLLPSVASSSLQPLPGPLSCRLSRHPASHTISDNSSSAQQLHVIIYLFLQNLTHDAGMSGTQLRVQRKHQISEVPASCHPTLWCPGSMAGHCCRCPNMLVGDTNWRTVCQCQGIGCSRAATVLHVLCNNYFGRIYMQPININRLRPSKTLCSRTYPTLSLRPYRSVPSPNSKLPCLHLVSILLCLALVHPAGPAWVELHRGLPSSTFNRRRSRRLALLGCFRLFLQLLAKHIGSRANPLYSHAWIKWLNTNTRYT